MYQNDKVMLLILDGWGHGQDAAVSAIAQAKTPFIDSLYMQYPNVELVTHGEQVGLPAGQMGNSEVGHLNIGAGRVVFQELLRINNALRDGVLAENPTLLETINYVKKEEKALHLMGLVSDGGVHSHIEHLKGICQICKKHDLKKVYIHAFMDGRDTDPEGGVAYLEDLQASISQSCGTIVSVIGRYYAMDRDLRWERIQLAYDLMVHGKGTAYENVIEGLKDSYKNGKTDEFVLPIVGVDSEGDALAKIESGDAVFCFNFRTDRCRQITSVLTQEDFPDFSMKKIPLYYVTMTNYNDRFKDIHVVFEKDDLKDTLGELLERAGKKQIRIAETEKYPHVTFFFSGGRENVFEGEERIMAASPKVATYDLQPSMSANELTAAILPKLKAKAADFICMNFANTDMVGHTGVFEAAVEAAETVDQCTQQIVETALANGYCLIIIADHGNADMMVNADGSPNTAHTTNPVPCFLVGKDLKDTTLKAGKLADIAPTILAIMGLEKSPLMEGENLIAN